MNQNIKRGVAIAFVFALAFALSGCVTQVTRGSSSSVSASDTSVSSSSQSQSSSSSTSSTNVSWTSAATADEAAKGAGIAAFGAPARTVIADFVFINPTFAYAEHVTQASYVVDGSAKLIVRKAEGAHVASITDRETSEFSQKWNNTYEGYDVTSHGNAQGAAATCVWNDGTKEYGVTIESLSNASVTMDAEDIDDIVKAVKAANSGQNANASAQQSQSSNNSSGSAPAFDIAKFVQDNGLGTFLRYYYTTSYGQGYWAIVTRGSDGGEYTTYADAQGGIVQGGPSPDYDGVDFNIEAFVQENSLGTFQRYYWIQGENGYGFWGIVTVDANGVEHTTYTDDWGNIVQNVERGDQVNQTSDSASAEPDFDVEALAQQYGLGQFEHYYWVQGSGDAGYWALVTQAADGSELTTYVDAQGNIIQGGI